MDFLCQRKEEWHSLFLSTLLSISPGHLEEKKCACGTDPEVRRETSFAPLNSEGRKQEALHGDGAEPPLGRAVLFFSLTLCLIKDPARKTEPLPQAPCLSQEQRCETILTATAKCLHHARQWVSAQPSFMFLGGMNDFHPHFTASLECLVSEPLTP